MAKKRANNMEELNRQINKMLVNTLNKDNNLVANEIKYTESEMVEQEVYAKYTPNNGEPWVYQRREDKGGLADVGNMEHSAQESGGKVNMRVVNMTPPNEEFNENNLQAGEVAELVEGGDGHKGLGYSYKKGEYLKPRGFQESTKQELSRNKNHKDALAMELRKKGLDVKNL